ncbi:MAG: phosphatase PAP2 family protein [Planctomycetota bacterium]
MRIYRRNGLWLRLFCACLILAAGCASPDSSCKLTTENPGAPREKDNNHALSEVQGSEISASSAVTANQPGTTKSGKKEPLWLKEGKEDFAKWPDRLIEDSKESFLRLDNATALLLAGGASIAMHNSDADTHIEGHFDRHPALHNWKDESLNIIGHPALHLGASGVWYVLSAESEDEFNRQRAWTMRNALTITWLTTMGLKYARGNETPNGKDYAWPSGHTSSSFTVASVLDEFYGPKVGIPAYVAASAVAYRMMDTGDHWASDVVFGATLGWVVGHAVAGRHKDLEVAGFKVMPYVSNTEEPTTGIGLLKRF